ncbi:PREDICTED: probable leucine-rich repeat receptor-like protein kinase At5g49770, partial [Populus euphratica]|uniref:Probable leucine-rich repeat receptor-like protein kinase At5g49770 n=1 Tax=Populus euphratica TaxID=75702 RepID=A0AAJ6UE58_POPEU
ICSNFNRNQLSGFIPPELFSFDMMLIRVLFDGNRLEGEIPSTLGLVQTLEVLRLNRNALSGEVPKNLNNLTNLNELNLANNKLAGPLPDLTKMDSLSYVDLSNNSFYSSESSDWFSTLPSLTTLVIENGSLQGTLTPKVFSFPNIQQVLLRNNAFNGTFDLDDSFSPQLQLVDLQNNQISAVTLSAHYKNKLILVGNPVCTGLPNVSFCQP